MQSTHATCVVNDISEILEFEHTNYVNVYDGDYDFIHGLIKAMKWCEMKQGYPFLISAYHIEKLIRNNISFVIQCR